MPEQKTSLTPVDLSQAVIQPLAHDALLPEALSADVLRLDRIHPVVSGNKWFKLKYHLQEAIRRGSKGIITFGGAWSNHLVATSYACRLNNLPAIGIVRGERPANLSNTLQDAAEYGMQLHFVSRGEYANETALLETLQQTYPDHFIVPQGGQSAYGVQGAAEIPGLAPLHRYTHIACAAGTGTMMAGIVRASLPHQHVLGISSVKISNTECNSITAWVDQYGQNKNYRLFFNYHGGGYARKHNDLIRLMNALFETQQLPTDFVYTGKLFYGLFDLINKKYFPPESRLLVIHSGGLQGNRSLPAGTLIF